MAGVDPTSLPHPSPRSKRPLASSLHNPLTLPAHLVSQYDAFVLRNSSQISQIESALRSLTYIIPGRFRDAEIASESIHSGVQLLALYHDLLLNKAARAARLTPFGTAGKSSVKAAPTPLGRYTTYWTEKSPLYRRIALLLQVVNYTQLLAEMAAKRRGERMRWRVVVVLEAIKAVCKLLLLRVTRWRSLVSPMLPEREVVPEDVGNKEDEEAMEAMTEELGGDTRMNSIANGNGAANGLGPEANGKATGHTVPTNLPAATTTPRTSDKDWTMPRTGLTLPSLPLSTDIPSYLSSRVLTADDIKPAPSLLPPLTTSAQTAAEVLHILSPLIFAVALAGSHLASSSSTTTAARRRKSLLAQWTPYILGLGTEFLAHQLHNLSTQSAGAALKSTPLEREEWSRRSWAMGWWTMRGAFYDNVTKGVVEGVRRKMPSLIGGILEDYEYLWGEYYFSTSA
jgi:peroxin-16